MKLAAAILFLMLPLLAKAQFTYTTNADGSLNLSHYNGSGVAVIPGETNNLTVTTIGSGAFEGIGVASAVIPDSVTSLGTDAFENCASLTNATLGDSIYLIGTAAFEGCSQLTGATIPNSVTNIGANAFVDCVALTNLTLGTNVSKIGTGAFTDCTGLTAITIPNSVTNLGFDTFDSCTNLNNVTMGNGLVTIGAGVNAFDACPFTSVTIGAGVVTSIAASEFNDLSTLRSIIVGNEVSSIGANAFSQCANLGSVMIGSGVTNIGVNAFAHCPDLTNICVNAANPEFSSLNGVLFDRAQDALLQYPAGLTNRAYLIPNGVTNIGLGAFQNCYSLTNITIPNGVTIIESNAFEVCTGLTTITIPSSVVSIGADAFNNCLNLKTAYFEGNAPQGDFNAFAGTAGVTVYYLPGTWVSGRDPFDFTIPGFWYQSQPQILSFEPSFGVHTNQFGFTISWATNVPIAVQACTNFSNPVWVTVMTNVLSGSVGTISFSDPCWTNYPIRYYRVSQIIMQ